MENRIKAGFPTMRSSCDEKDINGNITNIRKSVVQAYRIENGKSNFSTKTISEYLSRINCHVIISNNQVSLTIFDKEDWADAINKVVKLNGVKKSNVSDKIGTNYNYVYDMRCNKFNMSIDIFLSICKSFNFSVTVEPFKPQKK